MSAARRHCLFLAVWLVTLGCLATVAQAVDSGAEYALQLGIKMFPTLVGGNLDIDTQKNAEGKLLLLVVYQENRPGGEEVVARMNSSVRVIYKTPVQILLTDVAGFAAFAAQPVAGIFLTEPLALTPRTATIAFGIQKKAVVFSPFDGDVQQGILAGLHIAIQVQPALNLTTLRNSGIRMNQLFFKVAQTYE